MQLIKLTIESETKEKWEGFFTEEALVKLITQSDYNFFSAMDAKTGIIVKDDIFKSLQISLEVIESAKEYNRVHGL